MSIQHSYSYAATLQDSLKINWRVEDLIGDGKKLDFSKPFLPESLARTRSIEALSPRERLILNQIRGATYLHLFGLVEEFILPFTIDRAKDDLATDKSRARALLTFADEEAKHQLLFQRFADEFKRGFNHPIEFIGPAKGIAATVLAHSQLSVAILILHLEWLTQRHYLESVKSDELTDPHFASLLKHHWQEEAQHAKLDTLVLAELVNGLSHEEIEKGFDEFLAIGTILDGALQQQLKYDVVALEHAIARKLTPDERREIKDVQLKSYRWTFLVSGLEQPNFVKTIAELSATGSRRVQEVARALS